jgi:hypothetical protein
MCSFTVSVADTVNAHEREAEMVSVQHGQRLPVRGPTLIVDALTPWGNVHVVT